MENKLNIIIILFIIFFSVPIFSIENNLGFSIQLNYNSQMLNGLDVSAGLNYEIYFTKYFGLENIFFIGYTYKLLIPFSGNKFEYNSCNIIYKNNINFRFGSNRAKFFFSPFELIFYTTLGYVYYAYKFFTIERSNIYFDYLICLGISPIKLGLNIYLSKNYNIIFTPIYIYYDFIFIINPILYPLPFQQIGGGISLKFTIGKK